MTSDRKRRWRRGPAAAAGAAVLVAAVVLVAVAAAAGPAVPELARDRTRSAADTVEARAPFVRPPVSRLRARRSALLDSVGTGAVVLPSARPRDLETTYPQASDFRQDNDFLYLTGLLTPDSWLVLAAGPDGTRRTIVFVPDADSSRVRWTGGLPSPARVSRRSGIDEVRSTAEFERMVRGDSLSPLPDAGPLYVPRGPRRGGRELVRRLAERSGTGSPDAGPVRDARPLLAGLRLVKDDFELRLLREAVAITGAGIRRALRRARPGDREYEIEAEAEYAFHRRGAVRVGFPSIVGSGPNSVVLHYDDSRRRTEAGDLVVMDVGAEYSYYTADVTRTFPVSGSFTDRQRRVYRLVLGALRAAVDAVRPGATMAEVGRAAREHMRANSGDLCGGRSCERFFDHGVGHWLGMDVHDVGEYGTPFRPGMVLTVEPGLYLRDEGLGVRIEEDVLVTASGREVLSAALPRRPEEIEQLMAEDPR